MNTVWILNHYGQEPGGAGGTRHYSMARHLPAFGWRAFVLASSLESSTGRQRLPAGVMARLTPVEQGPSGFLWVRAPHYRGNGLRRVINMLAYTGRSLLPSTTRGLPCPAVVIGSSVHPFAAWAGQRLARRFGVPFVFEVRDLWPQTLIDLGALREGAVLTRLLQRGERWLYREARCIIVLLPQAHEYICPLGIPRDRIVWIPNGVDLQAFPESDLPTERETFTVMYFGAHGRANALEHLLRAMSIVERDPRGANISLRLLGDGPRKPALIQLAQQLQLQHAQFERPVPKRQIASVAAEADAFVFCLEKASVFRYGISSNKLFDFMASQRPVIFSCNASNNPVAQSGAGLSVEPDDSAALADAIVQLKELSLIERQNMARAGLAYVRENHDYRSLTRRLGQVLDEVVRPRPAQERSERTSSVPAS
ncbi:MAG TPA: glycosyltransferase family 4 protein [Verrucomicrobiota bacterium]|nr:glycosyltransferase family 4 protein [Verrucomicrobiota bacterium]HQK00560.1 glycosyltransferase family 4 protein [Verrucomicrobiota bacterium]